MADSESKRYSNIDLIKFIAILMVIALHIPIWRWDFYQDNGKNFEIWVQYCFRLVSEGVPLFFMVNGYLLFEKELKHKKHISKCVKLFVLFLFWATIQSINIALVNNTEISFSAIVNHIITLDYPFTLWFYKYLLFIYLLFPALKVVFDTNKKCFLFLATVTLFFATSIHFFEGLNYFLEYAGIGWLKGINSFLTDFYPLSAKGLASIAFFLLGGILNIQKNNIERRKKTWIIVGTVAWVLLCAWYTFLSTIRGKAHEFFWFGNICEVFFCVGIYAISLMFNYGKMVKNILGILGSNTNGVYLLHIIILPWIVNPFNSELLVGRFVHLLLIFAISLSVSIVLGKIPLVKRIINL